MPFPYVANRAVARALVSCVTLSAASLASPHEAIAQTAAPSVKVLNGELVSPSAASTYYGVATTSTNGLCAAFPSNAAICTALRPPEVKELARALRGDPDLIYEYLRNGVDTEFQYGLQKGVLGVIIDKSGTAFDQASLMVELLREAGFTASYKVGDITLTGAQFQAWTGLTDAKAACDFLAVGGIPAVINGTTSATCAYSGGVTGVTLSHAWVEAVIGGATYQFDPAYKPYTHKAGIDVKAGMGLVTGEVATAAAGTTGTQAGIPYVTALSQSALGTKLQTLSATMLARLRQTDMQGADLSDVIGGREIQPASRPVGGWRQAGLAYPTSVTATWTGNVPNQYRTTLKASSFRTISGTTHTIIDTTFFVDEIYGRNLGIRPKRRTITPTPPGAQYNPYAWSAEVFLDNVVIATGPELGNPNALDLTLTLVANHPFAAGAGGFADATVTKQINYNMPSIIAHGWGRTSGELSTKWEREEGTEETALLPALYLAHLGGEPSQTVSGKLMRMRLQAEWLAQLSATAEAQAELANARFIHHHSLGVVTSSMTVKELPKPSSSGGTGGTPRQAITSLFLDETTVIDLESAFGLVSRTEDSLRRRAAIHSIAATAAMLEGSVVEQLMDSVDTVSTARRFAWGNAPEAAETPSASSRLSYAFTAANAASAINVLVAENKATGVWGQFNGQEAIASPVMRKTWVSNAITGYANAGFDVVASGETMLGPGYRHGTVYISGYLSSSDPTPPATYERNTSRQVGGALIATKYDGAGDPTEIAHALPTGPYLYKGGGGPTIKDGAGYDANKSAQTLKDRFVDRSSAVGVDLQKGSAGFESPVLASVGVGEAPYRLDYRVELRGGGLRVPSPQFFDDLGSPQTPTGDLDGAVSNWDGGASLGSSGFEALGRSRADAAAQAIVAFTAMQDVWRQTPSAKREVAGVLVADWLGRAIVGNTATISQGGKSAQYVRLADGSYASTGVGGDRVQITGARVAVRHQPQGQCNMSGCAYPLEPSRYWQLNGVSFAAVGPHGDRRDYEHWSMVGRPEDHRQGHRLKTWTFPQGVKLTLDYPTTVGATIYEIPTRVSSNLGYELTLPTRTELLCADPLIATNAAVGITRATFNAVVVRSTTQRPHRFCSLANVYTPADTTTASLAYVYDTLGRVKEARDGVAIREPGVRGPHQFFIAQGYRGERQDPVGGRYAVETLQDGRLTRTIDELGRVVTSLLDGRKRVVSRIYPEGDRDLFAYDLRDNLTSLTRKPKPASPLADLVTTMTFGEGPGVWACVSIKVCNRPLTLDGPRTDLADVTNFTWDAATGNLTQVLKPADSAGVRPQIDYGYSSYTAGGATFSLMTSMTEKISSTVSTVTAYEYDAASRYLLKSSTVDSGGLGLKTCYQYDLTGNIVGVSDPRTTTCPATVQ